MKWPGVAASVPPTSRVIPGAVAIRPLILVHIVGRELHRGVVGERVASIAVVEPQQTEIVALSFGADGEGAVVSRRVLQAEIRQLDQQLVHLNNRLSITTRLDISTHKKRKSTNNRWWRTSLSEMMKQELCWMNHGRHGEKKNK